MMCDRGEEDGAKEACSKVVVHCHPLSIGVHIEIPGK